MTPFESLIAEFAGKTGLPLEADERDACSLETEGLVVTLQYLRERDAVALFAPVTEPGEDLPPETLRSALVLACHGEGTRGNYLGLFDGTLLLSGFVPFDGLSVDALERLRLPPRTAVTVAEGRRLVAASENDDTATLSRIVDAIVERCLRDGGCAPVEGPEQLLLAMEPSPAFSGFRSEPQKKPTGKPRRSSRSADKADSPRRASGKARIRR